MPMNYSLVIEPFDCWGFDLVGPFPPSQKYTYILVALDYVAKWVETIPTESVDHKTSLKMLKDINFSQVWCTKVPHDRWRITLHTWSF